MNETGFGDECKSWYYQGNEDYYSARIPRSPRKCFLKKYPFVFKLVLGIDCTYIPQLKASLTTLAPNQLLDLALVPCLDELI